MMFPFDCLYINIRGCNLFRSMSLSFDSLLFDMGRFFDYDSLVSRIRAWLV